MEHQYNIFEDALLKASKLISADYFNMEVANTSELIYRERVYCYELYHRLRQKLPNDFPFTLQGELDKKNHPIISQACGEIKPDFLVHMPGNMASNLVIVEVKSSKNVDKIGKDFKTLKCMTSLEDGYYKGISIIFGQNNEGAHDKAIRLYKKHCATVKEKIHLFIHELPKKPMRRM